MMNDTDLPTVPAEIRAIENDDARLEAAARHLADNFPLLRGPDGLRLDERMEADGDHVVEWLFTVADDLRVSRPHFAGAFSTFMGYRGHRWSRAGTA
jgi:hypothetical protein